VPREYFRGGLLVELGFWGSGEFCLPWEPGFCRIPKNFNRWFAGF
jgi:hypothetical protein